MGQYKGADGRDYGFLKTGGNFSSISVSSTQTTAHVINDSGEIVEYYADTPSTLVGFLENAGGFITLNISGAPFAYLFAINNSGQNVGEYLDNRGGLSNVVDTSGKLAIVKVPGAIGT